MSRFLLGCGVVGAVSFVATFLVDGATRPGYRPTCHPVSALALGPRGWVQTTNFVVCGLLMLAAAAGTNLALDVVLGPAFLAIFGLSLVASGVFPMDAMRGFPPGTPASTPSVASRHHRLHDLFGLVVFTSLPAAGIAFGVALEGAWAIFSFASALVSALLFVWFGMAWESDAPRSGLIQRSAILVGWTWIALLCSHLIV